MSVVYKTLERCMWNVWIGPGTNTHLDIKTFMLSFSHIFHCFTVCFVLTSVNMFYKQVCVTIVALSVNPGKNIKHGHVSASQTQKVVYKLEEETRGFSW